MGFLRFTDLVGGHPIVCSKHMLDIMFNEPQLLIVYRVALEIEKVYDMPNENGDTAEDNAIISMEEDLAIPPDYHLSDEGKHTL